VCGFISWNKMVLHSAGLVTFRCEGDQIVYLVLQHTQGHWAFAKGKVEAGETLQQTALRELKEEAGLEAQIISDFCEQYDYRFTDRSGARIYKSVSIFLGQAADRQVALSEEHSDYAWLPFDEAYARLSYGNSRTILQRAHNVLLSMPIKK